MGTQLSTLKNIYEKEIERAKIPTSSEERGDKIRGLCLELSEAYAQATKKPTELVSIYADVISITRKANTLAIGTSALLLFARRIEVEEGVEITLQESGGTGIFFLYTQEISGNLVVKTKTAREKVTLPSGKVGIELANNQEKIKIEPITRPETGFFQWKDPAYMLLLAQFQLAAALFAQQPQQAQALLTWIILITGGFRGQAHSPSEQSARDLYYQSTALLSRLVVTTSNVHFVPYLSQRAYKEEVDSLIKEVDACEKQYQRLFDKKEGLAERKKLANLMIDKSKDIIDLHKDRMAHAENAFRDAEKNVELARKRFADQKYLSQQASIEFKTGQQIWVQQQYREAMKSMLTAIFDFTAAAAGAVATGGAGAAGAAEKGAETVKKTLTLLEKIGKIADQINKIIERMQQLIEILQNMERMILGIKQVVSYSRNESGSGNAELPLPSPSRPDVISGQAEWDSFLEDVEEFLKVPIEQNIGGASDYRLALRKLAIYGKALLLSQDMLVKAGQELALLRLQKGVEENQRTRLHGYVKDLSDAGLENDILLQQLFMRNLSSKFWLFLALQNLTWAYRYEALAQKTPVLPQITKSALDFQADFNRIIQANNEARASFASLPQETDIELSITENDQGAYQGVVKLLREQRATTFTIDLSERRLAGLERVRLSIVRCYLEGVELAAGQTVALFIDTDGNYRDRHKGETFSFISTPCKRDFKYSWDAQRGKPKTITEGRIAPNFAEYYYLPTPFTQWRIALNDEGGKVDLKGLKSIKLAFRLEYLRDRSRQFAPTVTAVPAR